MGRTAELSGALPRNQRQQFRVPVTQRRDYPMLKLEGSSNPAPTSQNPRTDLTNYRDIHRSRAIVSKHRLLLYTPCSAAAFLRSVQSGTAAPVWATGTCMRATGTCS